MEAGSPSHSLAQMAHSMMLGCDSRRLSRVQWQSGGAEAASIEGHTQA
ncbi:unnamed protein product [Staurois parvus]|uniref:Uncharacterized protein n=1 Tax=Staurois parvus TaxID=386267 RepID=A0ABN9CBV3_9NEOB|nr:unnamed protein product [Staurois parvus]